MTGFAALAGAHDAHRWSWEVRSVNGKGLDLRLRVPDWIEGLEAALRPLVSALARRGNVTLSLRISREDAASSLSVNTAQATAAIAALKTISQEAAAQGLELAPSRAADIAMMRGVMEQSTTQDDPAPLRAALLADVTGLLDAFDAMRVAEGAALHDILTRQLDEVSTLVTEAEALAEARKDEVTATLKRNLARVLDNTDGADPDRVAQELALLAVKADITEELDRLRTHVDAARAHLADGGAVGRKLDFLMQEFNREANTLCSKAQNADLTRVGLALKALIDQMREQVQNVE
ncbi:YicC/YloC family endoribonuclease [Tateyamaria sp. SN6-1]|uniref:YicC/YloC family endoribonuclease n=1 Tax=Tateyamaria sp. SN6-1 TaxID=3092148 RepID=UPI0039F61FFA